MALRHIGAWLLRRWPVAGGALILAALVGGFAFGTFYSDGEVRILAQDPDPTPTVSFPVNTPTDAELDELKAIYVMTATASAPQGAIAGALIVVEGGPPIPTPTSPITFGPPPTPRSTAQAEYWASDTDRTIYLEQIERVIYLPESIVDVHIYNAPLPMLRYWCGAPDLYSPVCPFPPAYELKLDNGDSVTIDSAGYIFASRGVNIPSFLDGYTVIRWPWGTRSREEIVATAEAFATQEANKALKEAE